MGILERIEANQLEIMKLLVTASATVTPLVVKEEFFYLDTTTNIAHICGSKVELDNALRLSFVKQLTAEEFALSEAPLVPTGTIVTKEVPPAPQNKPTLDPYAGVDKQGVIWDERIHSKADVPIAVTTGFWKRKRGITDKLYETVMHELLAKAGSQGPFFWVNNSTNTTGVCETRAEMDKLLTISSIRELTEDEFDALIPEDQPLIKKAPAAPAKKAPALPTNGLQNPLKGQVLIMIKSLTDVHRAEPHEISQLMVEITGFDTVSKITDEKLLEFKEVLETWLGNIETAQDAIDQMQVIAEANGFVAELNAGIETILEPHDADCVALVNYSAIAGVNEQLQAYLATWLEM